METTDFTHEDLRELRRGDIRGGSNVVHHLGELIHKYDHGVLARLRARKRDDQVERHLLPRTVGDRQRLK